MGDVEQTGGDRGSGLPRRGGAGGRNSVAAAPGGHRRERRRRPRRPDADRRCGHHPVVVRRRSPSGDRHHPPRPGRARTAAPRRGPRPGPAGARDLPGGTAAHGRARRIAAPAPPRRARTHGAPAVGRRLREDQGDDRAGQPGGRDPGRRGDGALLPPPGPVGAGHAAGADGVGGGRAGRGRRAAGRAVGAGRAVAPRGGPRRPAPVRGVDPGGERARKRAEATR